MVEVNHAALEAAQAEIEALNELTEKAELELALKRNELMVPIYEKRREIIAKIPKFWPTVLQLSDATSELVTEKDLPALEYLTDVWVEYNSKDPRLFEIIFTFSENPYFTNKELIKKILVREAEIGGEEPYSENFEIKWKEGKNLTSTKRKKDNEEGSSISFFEWFSDDDASVPQFIAHDFFAEALSIYGNEGDDEDEFEGSVDLEGFEDDEEEEEEHPKKKNKK
ncbi:hypothetical protein BGZ46_008535 [Entomortierella lignicola]|nr:hypothetical protein BGZ46_008535 [Entomortierella lignicola]